MRNFSFLLFKFEKKYIAIVFFDVNNSSFVFKSNTFHSLHQSTYKVYTEVDEENCYYEGLSNQITTIDKLLADGLNHLGL